MEAIEDPLLPGKLADFEKCRVDLTGKLTHLAEVLPHLTGEGVSYLDLKNSLLLHYSTLMLSHLIDPGHIEDSTSLLPVLIQTKSLIERLRPLDSKLQYQLDKIAKGNAEAELNFKPNAEEMDTQLRVSDKKGVYAPPKLQAVEPDVQQKKKRSERETEHKRRELAQSSLIEELREELGDEPVEIRAPGKSRKLKQIEDRERRYEEENYTRVVVSKKDRKTRQKLRQELEEPVDELEDISKFLKMGEGHKTTSDRPKRGRR